MKERREPRAASVEFTEEAMIVRLDTGDTIEVPLAWVPWLRDASDAERARWRLLGGGIAIDWPLLGHDLTTRALVALASGPRSREE